MVVVLPSPELPAGPPSEPELPPETVAAVVTCGPPVPLVSPSNREPPDMPPSGLEPLDPLGARELRVGLPSEDAAVVAADESPSGPRPELPLGPLRDPPSDPPDEPRSWPLVVTPAAVSLCDMPWSPLRAPMPIRSRTRGAVARAAWRSSRRRRRRPPQRGRHPPSRPASPRLLRHRQQLPQRARTSSCHSFRRAGWPSSRPDLE